eukprot:scaffold908_cov98-Isochrysis_galbana.AAC.1
MMHESTVQRDACADAARRRGLVPDTHPGTEGEAVLPRGAPAPCGGGGAVLAKAEGMAEAAPPKQLLYPCAARPLPHRPTLSGPMVLPGPAQSADSAEMCARESSMASWACSTELEACCSACARLSVPDDLLSSAETASSVVRSPVLVRSSVAASADVPLPIKVWSIASAACTVGRNHAVNGIRQFNKTP